MSKHQAKGLRRWRRLSAALAAGGVLLGLLGGAAPAQAAAMPAGTVIRSMATATYIPAGLAQAETVFSNELIATVQAVEALALTQDQTVTRPPSSTVVLSHLLANTGNVASSYTIDLANNAGGCDADTLDLERLRVVHDINGNGVADAGEPEIRLHTAKGLELAPGESAALLAMGTVPGVASGQACVALSAITALQGLSGVNRDRVQVGSMAALSLTKSASYPGYIVPGETRIDFSVIGTNIGAQDARPSAVMAPADTPLRVNGASAALVLLRDLVPAGTQYIAGTLQSAAAGAVKLFRLPGDPPFSYRTVEDASAVEVAIGLPAPLARNASAAMQFAVRALAGQSGEIRNTAQAYLHDGMRPALAESNTVVIANRASIGVAKAATAVRAKWPRCAFG